MFQLDAQSVDPRVQSKPHCRIPCGGSRWGVALQLNILSPYSDAKNSRSSGFGAHEAA